MGLSYPIFLPGEPVWFIHPSGRHSALACTVVRSEAYKQANGSRRHVKSYLEGYRYLLRRVVPGENLPFFVVEADIKERVPT
jgi:hypothetical protein